MPGKHKKGKKGKDKIFLGMAVFLICCFECCDAYSYFPHKIGSQEVRITASSLGGIGSGKWGIEGQLVGVKSKGNLSLAGVFGMSSEEAHIGAEIVYEINPFVFVSMTGKFHNDTDVGANARVYLNLPAGNLDLMPFIALDHKRVGAVGAVSYFNFKDVLFSLGVLYKPPIGENKNHNVSLVLGSGFHGMKRIK